METLSQIFTIYDEYTVRNFYRNFPKREIGVLLNYSFVKLRYNYRKFSYFLVNLKWQFLDFYLQSVEYSDTCIWKF